MNSNIELAENELNSRHCPLFARFPPEGVIEALESVPSNASYHAIPGAVSDTWRKILAEFGESGFDAYQRITMIRLIKDFPEKRFNDFTGEVIECFNRSFIRIANNICDPAYEQYRTLNDIFLKDLAICRRKLFPAGAQVVEQDSGFHRSLVFRSGIRQAIEVVSLLLSAGGNTHWYQIHTHLSETEDFNPDGWNACYCRLADMMKLNPHIRGMWGGSWFYDPALEEVSPRLAYLRRVPQENGARVFFSEIDLDGGALSKSASRRKAYESGKYTPRAYALIWPRKELMQWADRWRPTVTE